MSSKAAVYRGDKTFTIETVETPPPGPGQVQIDVAYCGICGTDLHIYLGHMDARVGFERTIGHEMSGRIAALGEGVEGLAPGQPIVVRPLDHCGDCPACRAGHEHICHNLTFIGIDNDGAFQQRWNVPAHTIHVLPDGLDLSHAALIEPLAVACHDVSRAAVQPGEDVLVIGGGPIGMLVAMVAREAVAKVTVTEINENRLAFAKGLGFETLNPKDGDVAEAVHAATGGKGADVIFEVSGSQQGVDLMTAAAATRGRICMVAIHATKPTVDMFQFFWRELDLLGARVYRPEDYDTAMGLLAKGVVDCEAFITDIQGIDQIQSAFETLTQNPNAMKSMIRMTEDA
ncbi:Zn-dependent alcohol dehydrogenase [Jannaschia pagri]|uniref:Zn-dependent alcohol dehydrogenase n=1 Tax=Jannaschia pagri TaxID=2829797 RepID=A0ABQ4NP07_9RHOB|nr:MULTISPECIES: alcohol dehydrogenase catalytic domain-containing protein [unclassified Jannaschia]GIT92119.1 Zn-dependent alcohol dehydrogenase [Jannaschia sp. AI_61]GIT95954.1 Zn-dependent alcohol dehydrogenase [Jannaschia sp. AI_62]